MSNGEEIVVRAAMKPLPTLMKPLASVDLRDGRARPGARRAQRRRRRRGARRRRRGGGRVRARARGAREVRRRRARRLRRRLARVPRAHPVATHALDRHLVLVGFMGAGKTTIGAEVARRLGREFVDIDDDARREPCSSRGRAGVPRGRGRRRSRDALASSAGGDRARRRRGRDARGPRAAARRVRRRSSTSTSRRRGSARAAATARSRGTRPSSAAATSCGSRCTTRSPTRARATPTASSSPPPASTSRSARSNGSASSSPDRPAALVTEPVVSGIHGADAQLALAFAETHELPSGEEAKQIARGRAPLARAPHRPRRHARRARRRLAHRRRRLRGGDVPPRHPVGARADDARRPGRRGDRRQDRDRPPRGQEPRRRVPLAGAHGDRPDAARDAAARTSG